MFSQQRPLIYDAHKIITKFDKFEQRHLTLPMVYIVSEDTMNVHSGRAPRGRRTSSHLWQNFGRGDEGLVQVRNALKDEKVGLCRCFIASP